MAYRETDVEMAETDRLTLMSPSISHEDYSNRHLEPIGTSAFIDDGSSAISSPQLRPESYRATSPAPLLPESMQDGSSHLAAPPPSFNPPSYRSATALPPYSPSGDKYTSVPDDLEGSRFTPQPYNRIPQYGWRIWSIVVLVVVITIVSIAVAITHTIKENADGTRMLSGMG
jgi:hypothetical protein